MHIAQVHMHVVFLFFACGGCIEVLVESFSIRHLVVPHYEKFLPTCSPCLLWLYHHGGVAFYIYDIHS